MKAIALSGKNVKGQTFSHTLAPITVFCGENESGKTARAIAAKLALMGYDLKLGKVASKTFKLSSGSVMVSGLKFADGSKNVFRVQKKGDSCSVTTEFAVESPGILLNEKEYLDKSGPGRQRFLFDLAAKDIKFEITDLISDMKSIKLEPHPPEAETVISDLCESLEQSDQARVENNQPLDEWFAALVAKFEKKSSEAKATAKTHRNAIQAAISNQALSGIALPQDQSEKLSASLERSEQLRDAVSFISNRISEVERQRKELEAAQKTLADNPAMEDNTAPLKAEVDRLKAIHADLEAVKKVEVEKLDTAKANQRVKQRNQLDEKLSQARQSRAAIEATIVQLENTASTNCDKCGSDHSHWNDAIVKAVQQSLSDNKTSGMQIDLEIKKLEAAKTDLQALIAEDVITAEQYQSRLTEASVANESRAKAIQIAAEHLLVARQALSRVEGDLKINRTLRANAQKKLDETSVPPSWEDLGKEFLTKFPGFFDTFQLMVDDDPENAYLIHLNRIQTFNTIERQALQAKQNEFTKRQAADASREESKKSAELSELREKVLDAALAKLKERQTKVITEGLVKFMAKASALTKTVLGFSLEFRDGDIGYFDGGQWIGYETFSGIQEALAMAGLRLSFAQEAPCKMLIVDELGIFSRKNKAKFIAVLVKLVQQGFMDNFIGMDVSSDDYGKIWSEGVTDSERNLLQLIEIEDKKTIAVNQ